MAVFQVEIRGVESTIRALNELGEKAQKETEELTKVAASKMAGEARKNLKPYVTGFLQDEIVAEQHSKLSWIVSAKAYYSAYVEFGTGPMTELPDDPNWKALARTFKGEKDADPGMQAQPFMYPAFLETKKLYLGDLNNLYKSLKLK